MKKLLIMLLVLTMMVCMVACGDGNDEKDAPATTVATEPTEPTQPTQPDPSQTTPAQTYNYKILVVDQDGNPIAGAFVIFCLEQCNFYQTNEEGCALIDAPIMDGYQAHIMSLPEGYEGYTFSEEYTNFVSGQTEMTLVATKP